MRTNRKYILIFAALLSASAHAAENLPAAPEGPQTELQQPEPTPPTPSPEPIVPTKQKTPPPTPIIVQYAPACWGRLAAVQYHLDSPSHKASPRTPTRCP